MFQVLPFQASVGAGKAEFGLSASIPCNLIPALGETSCYPCSMPVSPPYLTFEILQPLQNKVSPRNTSENVFSFVSWKHWWEEKLFCVLCKKPFNVRALSALFCSFTFPEVSPCKRNGPFHTEGWKTDTGKRGKPRQGTEHQVYRKTLKQHQGTKEGQQMCLSGAKTHLENWQLWCLDGCWFCRVMFPPFQLI